MLIVVGACFDERATGKLDEFCPYATIIHIDINAAELGKLRRPALSIRSDSASALYALRALVRQQKRPAWLRRFNEIRSQWSVSERIESAVKIITEMTEPDSTSASEAHLHPADVLALLKDVTRSRSQGGQRAFITTDVGQHQMWVACEVPIHRPRSLISSGGMGTMGFGLPAAIGVAWHSLVHPSIA